MDLVARLERATVRQAPRRPQPHRRSRGKDVNPPRLVVSPRKVPRAERLHAGGPPFAARAAAGSGAGSPEGGGGAGEARRSRAGRRGGRRIGVRVRCGRESGGGDDPGGADGGRATRGESFETRNRCSIFAGVIPCASDTASRPACRCRYRRHHHHHRRRQPGQRLAKENE